MSNINKQAQAIISDIRLKHGSDDFYAPIIRWDEFKVITGALEAAEKRIAELESERDKQGRHACELFDEVNSQRQQIAELVAAGIITKVGE